MPHRYLLIIFVFALNLFSCVKEKPDNSYYGTVSLTPLTSEVRPLQMLSFYVENYNVQDGNVSATLGGIELELYPQDEYNDKMLVALVPEGISTGTNSLEGNVNGTPFSASINVLPNVSITSPSDVFDQFYSDFTTAEYADYVDETELSAALNELRSLPDAEKLYAAQMLANNRLILDNIAQVMADAEALTGLGFNKSACDILCVLGASAGVIGAFISAPIVSAVGIGVLTGLVARALKPVIVGLWNKAVDGITAAIRLGYDRMAYITELVYDPALQMINNKTQALPDTIYLENGSPLKLAIKTVRQPIVTEANRDSIAEVGTFLDLYYKLKAKLYGSEFNVPELETEETEDFALDLDNFSVSVDNSLVTVSQITGTPELAEISFDSPQEGAHVFNFTYSYQNDEGEITQFTQTARLLNITEYTNWSGMGISFSDTDPRSATGTTDTYEPDPGNVVRWFTVDLGNFWHVNDSSYTGLIRVNQVGFRIGSYTGPGTYNTATYNGNALVGISDIDIDNDVPFDKSTRDWLWGNTDYCVYAESGTGTGNTTTVTITNEEQIGPYLVIEGNFNITINNDGYHSPTSCSLPASFSGDFRVAGNRW